jgi:hypothetical protein
MKTIFAVHHVFDCLDYNEHHYFTTFDDAYDHFSEIIDELKQTGDICEVYSDVGDEFYVQFKNGAEKVYIQEINL